MERVEFLSNFRNKNLSPIADKKKDKEENEKLAENHPLKTKNSIQTNVDKAAIPDTQIEMIQVEMNRWRF